MVAYGQIYYCREHTSYVMDALDEAIRDAGASAYVAYASSLDANLLYLSRFRTTDPVVYIRKYAESGTLIVPVMEYGRAVRESPASVITRADAGYFGFYEEENDPWAATARMIADQAGGDILVSAGFPFALATHLQSLCRLHLDTSAIEGMRAIKTPAEAECIMKVQHAAEMAMDHAISLIKNSEVSEGVLHRGDAPLTSEYVRTAIHKLLMDYGCLAADTIVSCGQDTALPHMRGSGPLLEGEPIVIDIFPQDEVSGYHSDMTRTVVKGEPAPELAEMYDAVRGAKQMAIGKIAAGTAGRDLYQHVIDYFTELGYDCGSSGFTHSLGHGVGLAVHEAPSLGPHGDELAAGNVVTVEPGLYYQGIGGVRLEDIGIVTEGGFSPFTHFREEFII